MKRHSLRIFSFAVTALVVLLVAGCTSAIQPATVAAKAATVPVTLTIPSMSPGLASALASRPGSGSRALMFLSSYSIDVYDETVSSWAYYENLVPQSTQSQTTNGVTTSTTTVGQQGPGNLGDPYTLDLIPNHTYDFYVYGYNSVEQPYGSIVSGRLLNQFIYPSTGATSGGNQIFISMTPSSPVWMNATEGSTGFATIQKSILMADKKTFASMGGEKWFQLSPSSDTLAVTITPTNGLVYASLYDEDGKTLTAGLSPAFGGGTTQTAVTLTAGVNAGHFVYLGFIEVDSSLTSGIGDNDSVQIQVDTSTLVDDVYDDALSGGNDTQALAQYLSWTDSYNPLTVTGLKAYDNDWYQFYVYDQGTYKVTVTADQPLMGSIQVTGAQGYLGYDSSWSQYSSGTKTVFSTQVTITSSGYYTLGVLLQGEDPNMHFPTVGGNYSLDVTYVSP